MKITFGPLSFDILLFLRLCFPATVFIGLCTGIFMVFISLLGTLTLTENSPLFVGGAWLLLLIVYIILGVVFTRFVARLLRGSFGSEERRIQRRMALLSGLPFYALCLLCLMALLLAAFFYPDAPDICASTGFLSLVGFVGFALVSGGYLLLLRFFSGRSTAIAGQ